MDKWLKQFIENYEGKSKEAKSIEDYLKENYKGNSYIPWATMERLTYMQDPNAEFETLTNENGNMVFTDSLENFNEVVSEGVVKNSTKASMLSHFVKVKLTFLGKVFVEEYPIQDTDYSALKIYNQNAVNKALKRALAKVASRATGLGLKLYENKDLQFDDDKKEDKKPEIKKTTKKVEPKKVEPKKVELTEEQKVDNILDGGVTESFVNGERTLEPQEVKETPKYDNETLELCNLIKTTDKDKMNKALQGLNVAILQQHGFKLSVDDEDSVLCEKLSHFQNVSIFTKAIKNMLGD